MTYLVEYMPAVVAAIESQIIWLTEQGTDDDRIAGWLADLFDLTESLYHSPRRHPIAEPESAELGFEIRRAVFGEYLIYYHVDDARGCVEVLHFRHAAHETGGLIIEGDE